MDFKPTKFQQNIFDFIKNESGNAVINAVAGSGKEQPIWSKVQTFNGPVEIGSLKINDTIIGINGKEQKVLGVFPQGIKDYYRVTFRDGSFTHCGLEHLWTINNAGKYNKSLKTLPLSEMIKKGFKKKCGDLKYRIPLCEPVEYPEIDVKINPYVLGLLIGNGSLTTSSPVLSFNGDDLDIVEECKRLLPNVTFSIRNTSENGLQTTLVPSDKTFLNSKNWIKTYLEKLNLCVHSSEKHIPSVYLRNSIENRKLLLRGLMDSDGSCVKNRTSFTSTSKQLINDIKELINSLGGIAIETKTDVRGEPCYRVNIKTFFCPFNASKKKDNWRLSVKNGPSRYISNIEKVGRCEQVCIKVSNQDSLYLTDNFIVTHNTTTLIEGIKLIDEKATKLFLAFNKSIKEEIELKVKKHNLFIDMNTCHGFGYSTILKNFEKAPTIDNYKYNTILKTIFNNFQHEGSCEPSKLNLDRTMSKYINQFDIKFKDPADRYEFQNKIIKISELSRLFLTDNKSKLVKICEKYGIEANNIELKLATNLIKIANANLDSIDYTDMIYLPNHLNLPTQKYDWVLIDECQDLNAAQRHLMLRTLHDNSRFIAVGDERQAIYAFSGADSESFEKLRKVPNTTVLPLSECFRCGSEIIKTVKDIVPQIEAHQSTGIGVVNRQAQLCDIKDGDMVICRNTYPLVKLCLKYIKMGIKATIIGSDIGKSITKLITKTKETDMQLVFDRLYLDLEKTLRRIMQTNDISKANGLKNPEYVNLHEKIQVIETIYKSNGGDANSIIKNINELFSDKKSGIIMSTIHKAKGLESDRVFIIHDDLLPSRYAEQEWELKQEENLRYVAQTRAKEYLGFVTDFDAFYDTDDESFANKVNQVKQSKHIGKVGDKIRLKGKIKNITHNDKFNSDIYTIEDESGNIYEKWGGIPSKYVIGGNLSVNSKINFDALITKHTSFMGTDKTTVKLIPR